ncbi:MAG: hypothetical protein HZB72_09180 [Burkholderiales bacterium]|nr:hypothetical protein [Burkholderiales bacterium]
MATAKNATPVKGIKVAALQEGGRYRAGRHWSKEPATVPVSDLSGEQLAQLRGDALLVVIDVDIEADATA